MSNEPEVRAAGSDPDSRKRELKTRIAAAETAGDTTAAGTLRKELDQLNAATSRAAAAGGDPEATKATPSGRTPAPAKSTTAKSS